MTSQKPDIVSRAEVEKLVDAFYAKVNRDPLLSPVFNEVAKIDWVHHLPIMYSFWETILFGDGGYQGNPFRSHVNLPVEKEHFGRWLELFYETVDELFEGSKAEEVKTRAGSIALIFQTKLRQMGRMAQS